MQGETKSILGGLSALCLLSLLTGCVNHISGSDSATTVLNIVRELHVAILIKQVALWSLLGVIGGVIGGVLACKISRPTIASSESTWLKVLRIVTFVIVTAICAWLGGCTGALEGGLRGTEKALNESVIGQQLLPKTASYCADVLETIAVAADKIEVLSDKGSIPDLFDASALNAFRENKALFDASAFAKHVQGLTPPVADKLRSIAKTMILTREPGWKGGTGETILDYGLDWVSKRFLPEETSDITQVTSSAQRFAVDLESRIIAAHGTAQVTREQMSSIIVSKYFIPSILTPLRAPIRASQLTFVISMVIWVGAPLIIFFVIDMFRKKKLGEQNRR